MFKQETLITLKYYSDPGHGWVAVKRKLLDDLGIADQITIYSYQKGKTVYLEEDRDLGTLLSALGNQVVGVRLEEKHTNRYSPIRKFAPYLA